MNRAITAMNLPTLPKDLRSYDRDLRQKLKVWSGIVTEQINSEVQGVGAVLPSAATLVLTNYIHHVSGTAPIQNIIAPAGFTGTVVLIPDGLWTLVTGGNIASAITATAGKALFVTFDGTTWWPDIGGGGGSNPAVALGTLATIPAAGIGGRLFFATDISQLFVDNGAGSWVAIP